MAKSFSPALAYNYLVQNGYSPVQAAAISGNIQQESGFNPNALNEKEGAYGLVQWRLDRRAGLENYAKSRGADPSDPYVQLDYIGQEMNGPEAKNAADFRNAQDLGTANAALKRYIRYGDDSQGDRLRYASMFGDGGQGYGGTAAPLSSPTAVASAPGILTGAVPQQASLPIAASLTTPGLGAAQMGKAGADMPAYAWSPQQASPQLQTIQMAQQRPVNTAPLQRFLQTVPSIRNLYT